MDTFMGSFIVIGVFWTKNVVYTLSKSAIINESIRAQVIDASFQSAIVVRIVWANNVGNAFIQGLVEVGSFRAN